MKLRMKAQVKMMETIAVLLVFFMLLAIGIIFYAGYQKTQSEQLKKESAMRESVRISQRAAYMVELQCTIKSIRSDNCIDLLKLQALKEVLAEESNKNMLTEHYYEAFKNSKITIQQIYPQNLLCTSQDNAGGNPEGECIIYHHNLSIRSSNARTSFPFRVYDPLAKYREGTQSEPYYFGALTVDAYY